MEARMRHVMTEIKVTVPNAGAISRMIGGAALIDAMRELHLKM